MTGIDSYSITPATNATADAGAINWAEGQPPSTVNNTARQMLADTRTATNDLIWFQYGTGDQGPGNIAVPSVYSSATAFTITGADVTPAYEAGRRVRAQGSTTGTIYGAISSSSYDSGNSRTTVNVDWDSGSLSNETLVICISQIPVTGDPIPGSAIITWVPAISIGTATTGITYATNTGTYSIIGRRVFFDLQIVLSSKGLLSGTVLVTGLPFTATNTVPRAATLVVNNLANGVTCPMAVINQNTTNISLFNYVSASGLAAFADTTLTNSSNLILSGNYTF